MLFEVVYYVLSSDFNQYMDIQQDINLALMRLLTEQGAEFAYPTHMLHIVAPINAARTEADREISAARTAAQRSAH